MWAFEASLGLLGDPDAAVHGGDPERASLSAARDSSTIWLASSRVGASTSAAGRGPSAAMRSASGIAKASVLPEPVGDFASTSRPARMSPIDEALYGERLGDAAAPEGASDGIGNAETGE